MNLKLNSFNRTKANLVFLLGLFFIFNFLLMQNAWAVDEATVEEIIPNEFQGGGVAQGWQDDDAEWAYSLPFTFNFFGVNYTDIKIGSNGFICLDDSKDCTSYPVLDDDYAGPIISPLGMDLRTDVNPTNDIYITENADNVVIRWDAVEYGEANQINFEAILYYNGSIKFNYGDQAVPPLSYGAEVGISKGDAIIYTASAYDGGVNFDMVDTSAWGYFGPVVASTSPTDDTEDVLLDTDLSITFNELVNKGTGNIYVKKASDDSTVETIDAASANISGWGTDTLAIDLSNGLSYYAGYYINIEAGFAENSGGVAFSGILDSTTWNFVTQSIESVIETIPDCECYDIGSAEASQPAGSTLSYSNDDQATWTYVPQDDGTGKDCAVTDIRLVYDDVEHVAGEDLEAEFIGTFSNTETVSDGNGEVELGRFDLRTTKTFGGSGSDIGTDVAVDSSGNIFSTGYFMDTVNFDANGGTDNHISNGSGDVFITKYNADGSYGWTRTFGGAGYDSSYGISIDSSGNVLTSGSFSGTVDFDATAGTDNHTSSGTDIFITKYNADGSYGWTRTLGGTSTDISYGISKDSSNNVFATGRFSGTVDFDATAGTDNRTSAGLSDIFITKYNADGSYGWTRTFGGTSSDEGYGIFIDSSNNVFATGRFSGTVDFDATAGTDNRTSAGLSDIFITKYNADGSYGWTRAFGGTGDDYGYDVEVDNSGNIFATGNFYNTVDFDATAGTDSRTSNGYNDAFITKYNADGSYGWTRAFGNSNYGGGDRLSLDSSGNVFIIGMFLDTVNFDATGGTDNHTPNGLSDIFITRYNADGSYGWTRTFGGANYDGTDVFGGIYADDFGNIFAAETFSETVDFDATSGTDSHLSNGSYDIFITKYSTDGSYGSFDKTYYHYSPGTYQTLITPSDVPPLSWGMFEATQTAPTGTSLEYEIFDSTCTTSLIAQTADTTIDLSSIDADTYGELCLEVTFETTDDQITPSLDLWSVTYILPMSDVDPSFVFSTTSDPSCSTNSIPSDIVLSNGSIDENQVIGTTVGTLSTTDADGGDTHTYSFACATPGADDASFQISGAYLGTNAIFDFETKNSYAICIRTDDGNGGTYDENFIISINDVDENAEPEPTPDPAQDEDEDEELSIELIDIKKIAANSVDLKVEVENYVHKTLDFKVRVRNVATDETEEVKFTEKVKSDGKITLTIEDLLPGTEYTFKVKVSEEDKDDYTDYSNTKRATTEKELEEDVDDPAVEPIIPEYPVLPEVVEEDPVMEDEQASQPEPEPTISAEVSENDNTSKNSAMALLEGPRLQELPTALKVIGLVTGASMAVAATSIPLLPASPTPVSSGFSRFMSFFGILTKKSRRKNDWGVVFDAETRRPIPNVSVAIVTDNKIVDTVVTDQEGRFGFLASPGTYSLQVAKDKYELYAEDEKDELYGDLYTGKTFEIKEGEMVKLNIAMETTSINWKEFVQRKISAYTSLWSVIKKDAFVILFYTGFIASSAIAYFSPTILNITIILIYLAMLIYNLFFKSKSFGMVTNQERKPVPFSVLSFYPENQPDKRIAFTVSDVFGRYYQLIQNGKYLMKVQGQTISGQSFNKALQVDVKDGVVREDVVV